MDITRNELLERVLDTYSRWYDVERCDEKDLPLAATAQFHEHGTGYVLVKRAQTWVADRHEYTYFFTTDHLTKDIYDKLLAKTLELGEPLVNPVAGHMSTNIVMVVVCDSADEDALAALKKCRIKKSFQFSLKGWMEVQTAAIDVGKATITANAAAANTAKFLKNVAFPQTRRETIFNRIFGRK